MRKEEEMFIKWREENKPLSPEKEAELAAIAPPWARFGQDEPNRHRLYAYLAESKRVEGKPRQRIIAYLGSIPVRATQGGSGEVREEYELFWYHVIAALCRKGVSHDAFFDALHGIQTRVKRPSDHELIQIANEHSGRHPRWHKNYEATIQTIGRLNYYSQWFSWD